MGKEYYLVFRFYLTKFSDSDDNIISINKATTSDSQILAVWLNGTIAKENNTRPLTFCTNFNGNSNDCVTTTTGYPLYQWHWIVIRQTLIGSDYVHQILVSRKLVRQVVNTFAENYNNATLYASAPWFRAQAGQIKDYQIFEPGMSLNSTNEILYLNRR